MDRLVDYFAVCGLPSNPELLDSSRALEAERARDIMDIAVVFGNDEPPDGFMTIMHTPSGFPARFDQMQMSGLESRTANVYLAYRRRDRDEHGPAISSIEVIYKSKNEKVPQGYKLITTTSSGRSANLVPSNSKGVYLAIRRQDATEKYERKQLFEHDESESDDDTHDDDGKDDDDDDEENELSGFGLEAAIQDVCVILVGRNEEIPDGFAVIDKALNTRNFAVKTCLAVRKGLSVGLCDVCLKPKIMDRFPHQDYRNFPLPSDLIEMFSFPQGIRLKRATLQDSPPAVHFSYAMTGEGNKCYANALIFYEPLDPTSKRPNKKNSFKSDDDKKKKEVGKEEEGSSGISRFIVKTTKNRTSISSPSTQLESNDDEAPERNMEGEEDGGNVKKVKRRKSKPLNTAVNMHKKLIWVPKCICLISHYPFLKSFKQWLIQLYALSLSLTHSKHVRASKDVSTIGALESHISQLLLRTPVPLSPSPFFLNNAGIPIEISLSHFASPVILKLPPRYGLPLLDVSFNNLLRCLDIDNILTIFANLLLERKVLLRSKHCSLITGCCECFLSMLFPFVWSGSYLPRITAQLLEYIGCPGALLVGCHDDTIRSDKVSKNNNRTASSPSEREYAKLRSTDSGGTNELEGSSGVGGVVMEDGLMHLVKRLDPEDLVIVDLDYNEVCHTRTSHDQVTFTHLPRAPAELLRKHLEIVCSDAGFYPGEGLGDMVNIDGLFELPSSLSANVLLPSFIPSVSSSEMIEGDDSEDSVNTTNNNGDVNRRNVNLNQNVDSEEDTSDDESDDDDTGGIELQRNMSYDLTSPVHSVSLEDHFDERVRSYFLTFMTTILNGYDKFLIDPKCDWQEQHSNSFDKDLFTTFAVKELTEKQKQQLSTTTPSSKQLELIKKDGVLFGEFLDELIQTQMFAVLEHSRMEACDPRLLFFDDMMHFYHNEATPSQVKQIRSGLLLLSTSGSKPKTFDPSPYFNHTSYMSSSASGDQGDMKTSNWSQQEEAFAKNQILDSDWMSALKDQRMKYASQASLHDGVTSATSKEEAQIEKKPKLKGWAALKKVVSNPDFCREVKDPLQFLVLPNEHGLNRVVVKLKPAELSRPSVSNDIEEDEEENYDEGGEEGSWPKQLNRDYFNPKTPLYHTLKPDSSIPSSAASVLPMQDHMEIIQDVDNQSQWIHDTRLLLCLRTGSETFLEKKEFSKKSKGLFTTLSQSSLYPSSSSIQTTTSIRLNNLRWGVIRSDKLHLFPKSVQQAIFYSTEFREAEQLGTPLPASLTMSAQSSQSPNVVEDDEERKEEDRNIINREPSPNNESTGNSEEDEKNDKDGEVVEESKKWSDESGITSQVSFDGKIIQFNDKNNHHYVIDMENLMLFNTNDASHVKILSEQTFYNRLQSKIPGHLLYPLKTDQGSMLLQYPSARQETLTQRAALLAANIYGAWFFCLPAAVSHAAAHYGEGASVRRVVWRGIGALEQLNYHRNVQEDEAICRAILSSCRKGSDYGGVDLGPVSSYILLKLKNRLNGQAPNALTGGQYMHALASGFHAAKRLKRTSSEGGGAAVVASSTLGPPLAPFAPWLRRLEDTGRLVHRRALLHRTMALRSSSPRGSGASQKLTVEDRSRGSLTADESGPDLNKDDPAPPSEKKEPPPVPPKPGPITYQSPPPRPASPSGSPPTMKPRRQPRCLITDSKANIEFMEYEIVDLGLIEGLFPGDDLLVITPSNQRVRVKVPLGVKPGDYFRLQVPVSVRIPKKVYRFNIFMLWEDHPPLRLATTSAPNGIAPSKAIVDHPIVANFKPPFAICYKPNYIATESILSSPIGKTAPSSSSTQEFDSGKDRKIGNEGESSKSKHELSQLGRPSDLSVATDSAQCIPHTPGTASSSSNPVEPKTNHETDTVDEEKLNKEIRRLSRLAASEVLQHKSCCYATCFTDPQAAVSHLYQLRKLQQLDNNNFAPVDDMEDNESRSSSRSRASVNENKKSAISDRRASYSVGSSDSGRGADYETSVQKPFFTPQRRRSTNSLGSVSSPLSSPPTAGLASSTNTMKTNGLKEVSSPIGIVVDAEVNLLSVDSGVGSGAHEGNGSLLFDERDFNAACVEIGNWLNLFGFNCENLGADLKTPSLLLQQLFTVFSRIMTCKMAEAIVSNCEVRSLQGLLNLSKNEISKIVNAYVLFIEAEFLVLKNKDMNNGEMKDLIKKNINEKMLIKVEQLKEEEDYRLFKELTTNSSINFLVNLKSQSVLSRGVSPSTLRVAMMWSGVSSPHVKNNVEGVNNKEQGVEDNIFTTSSPKKQTQSPSCPLPITDEQLLSHWLLDSGSHKDDDTILCPETQKKYQPRLYFRVLEPYLDLEANSSPGWDGDVTNQSPTDEQSNLCPRWKLRAWGSTCAEGTDQVLSESPACLSPPVCGPLDLYLMDGAEVSTSDTSDTREYPTNNSDSNRRPRCYVGSIAYLSPSKLREGLELALGTYKTDSILQREALRNRYPELFWNLWWYSARFGLPLPLSEGPDDLTAQWVAVCGWDALQTHRMAQRTCQRLISASLNSTQPTSTSKTGSGMVVLKPSETLAALFSEFSLMSTSTSNQEAPSSVLLPRSPCLNEASLLCMASLGGFRATSQESTGPAVMMKECEKVLDALSALHSPDPQNRSTSRGAGGGGGSNIDLSEHERILQDFISTVLKHRDDGRWKSNLYRYLMRLVVTAPATRINYLTTFPVQKHSFTTTTASSSSPENHYGLSKNNANILNDIAKPSPFDTFYSRMIQTQSHQMSEYDNDIGIDRHFSDLSPLPPEVTIRNMFGHFF